MEGLFGALPRRVRINIRACLSPSPGHGRSQLSALSQLPGQLAAAAAQRPSQRGYRRHALAWERSRGAPAVHIQKKSTAARTFCRRLAFVPAVFILKARGWLPDDTSVLKCRVEALFECRNQRVRQHVLYNGRVHMASFWRRPRFSLKFMRGAISWA